LVHALVLVVGELVLEHAVALVLPHFQQDHVRRVVLDHLGLAVEHARGHAVPAALEDGALGHPEDALEDAAQVAQVEDVMELGRRRQHFLLEPVPQGDGSLGELPGDLHGVAVELGGREGASEHLPVNVVDGHDGGEHKVEEEEAGLQPVGNVIRSATRDAHGGDVLEVVDHLPLAALVLVEEREPRLLHKDAHHLVGDLVAPRVHLRHGQVVEEDGHRLARRRAVVAAAALLQVGLDGVLKHVRGRGRREIEPLVDDGGLVQGGAVHKDGRRLGRTGAADEEHRVAVLVQAPDEEEGAGRVHSRDEQIRKVELVAGRVPEREAGEFVVVAVAVSVAAAAGASSSVSSSSRSAPLHTYSHLGGFHSFHSHSWLRKYS